MKMVFIYEPCFNVGTMLKWVSLFNGFWDEVVGKVGKWIVEDEWLDMVLRDHDTNVFFT